MDNNSTRRYIVIKVMVSAKTVVSVRKIDDQILKFNFFSCIFFLGFEWLCVKLTFCFETSTDGEEEDKMREERWGKMRTIHDIPP